MDANLLDTISEHRPECGMSSAHSRMHSSSAPTFPMPPRLRHDKAQRQRFGTPQELTCPLCGREVAFGPRARLVDCPSCGAPLVRGPDDPTPIAPTGVLRFQIDEAAVPALAARGIKRFGMKRPQGATLSSFERIYVPMWRFTTHVVCSWVQERRDGDAHGSTRSTGEFADDYEQHVAASTEISSELLQRLEDLALTGAEPFSARAPGVRILPVNVPVQDAWVLARTHFDSLAMRGSSGEGYFVYPHWSREEGALVLVPAYLGHEATRHVSVPVLVDGISGRVHGGIDNPPFTSPLALPRGCRSVLKVMLLLGLGYAIYLILDRLGLPLLDLLDLLSHMMG